MAKVRADLQPGPQPTATSDIRGQIEQEVGKPVLMWWPTANSDIAVELESCVIFGVPEELSRVTDENAKIMYALLSEITELREKVEFLNGKITADKLTAHTLAVKDAAAMQSLAAQAQQDAAQANGENKEKSE